MKKIILGAICILCLQSVDCMQRGQAKQQLRKTVQIQNLDEVRDNVFYTVRYLMTLHDYCNSLPDGVSQKSEWLSTLNKDCDSFMRFVKDVDDSKNGVKRDKIEVFNAASTDGERIFSYYAPYNSDTHINLLCYLSLAQRAIEEDCLEKDVINQIHSLANGIHGNLVKIASEMYASLQDILFEDISEKQESKDLMAYLNQKGLNIDKIKVIKPVYNGQPTNQSLNVLPGDARTLAVMNTVPPNIYWQIMEDELTGWFSHFNCISLQPSVMDDTQFYSLLPLNDPKLEKDGNRRVIHIKNKPYVINHESGHASCEVFNTIWALISEEADKSNTFKFGGSTYNGTAKIKADVDNLIRRKLKGKQVNVKGKTVNSKDVKTTINSNAIAYLLEHEAEILQLIGGAVKDTTLYINEHNDIVYSVDNKLPIRTDYENAEYRNAKWDLVAALQKYPVVCLDRSKLTANYEFLSLLIRLYGRDPIAYRQQMGF